LPVLLAESLVVKVAAHEEVAVGDGVVNGQAGSMAHGIGVGRQLSALEKEGARVGELRELFLAQCDHAGLDRLRVDLLAEGHSLEARDVLGADDPVAGILGVHTALIANEVLHGLEGRAVSSHDDDLLVLGVGAGDSGKLCEGRHEDRNVGPFASLLLEPHHEAAVTSDALHLLLVDQPVDGLVELFFDFGSHGVLLAHAEGQAGHNPVEYIIAE